MRLIIFALLAFVTQWPLAAYEAQRLQPCQYNNGKWIQVRSSGIGKRFTLEWEDGPSMTYTWVGSNLDIWNIVDTKGGRWHYDDNRTMGGFTLVNIDNGNQIKCLSTKI